MYQSNFSNLAYRKKVQMFLLEKRLVSEIKKGGLLSLSVFAVTVA